MSHDDETQVNADAEDQHEGEGEDLDTNDTDTGADEDQGTGDADGDDAGGDKSFETQFKDQQQRANKYEGFLKKAGIDPKTGKPKEQARAPKKDGNELSEKDSNRIAKTEERSERAEARSLGYMHTEDIEYLRKQAHKNFDGDLEAAAGDEFVKNKLERMKAARDTKEATPPPNRRSGSSRSNKGLPDFSKMSNAEFDKWERENRA